MQTMLANPFTAIANQAAPLASVNPPEADFRVAKGADKNHRNLEIPPSAGFLNMGDMRAVRINLRRAEGGW